MTLAAYGHQRFSVRRIRIARIDRGAQATLKDTDAIAYPETTIAASLPQSKGAALRMRMATAADSQLLVMLVWPDILISPKPLPN